VPFDAAYGYGAGIQYQEAVFSSDVLLARDLTEETQLPVTIYERSEELDTVTLTAVDIVIESQLNVDGLGPGLVVSQVNTYENATDRFFHLRPPDQNFRISLVVQVPPGSIILNNPDGAYIVAQEQGFIVDTRPVLPSEHVVEVLYSLAYEDGATIDLPVDNAFQGDVTITVAVPALNITGDNLQFVGTDTVQTRDGAVEVKRYRGSYDLARQESIIFDIDGRIGNNQNTSEAADVITGDYLLPALLVIIALFILVIVVLVVMQRRYKGGNQREIERLLAHIARIEDMLEKGQLNHDVLQRQRMELKAKLAALMTDSQNNPEV
jgi:hypothetical protein